MLSCFCLASLPFLLEAMAKAVRLADKFDDVTFVREPPDQRIRHFLIAKNRVPVGEAEVARDDDRHPLVEITTLTNILQISIIYSANSFR